MKLITIELEQWIRQRIVEKEAECRECTVRGLLALAERAAGQQDALRWVLRMATVE